MWKFIYIPLRIAQGAFERVPWVVFRQSMLQEGGERALVVPSNLDDRQILFSNEEDDEASHTASKNAIPSCAAEWHFLDLVKVLVEVMNFMRIR